jgi:predicted MFS family arabinose efflux permease
MSLDITPTEALLVSPNVLEPEGLPDRTLWIMAAACGTSAANIYYNQPLLGDIAKYFHATAAQAGLVATAAAVGYGTGIFFFVPLGDLMERRRLVLALVAACCVLLIGTALSPVLWGLIVLQLLVGITAVSAQVLIPLGIDLTPPERRGHTVGVLMAGLLVGILLARTVSGFIGDAINWRAVYVMASVVMVVMFFVLHRSLPHRPPSLRMSYPRLMHSMLELLKTQPQLWISAAISGLTFATFTGFWTTLSFLMEEHFHRGASEAGLFGIIGVGGAMAAPLAGKLTDKRGHGFTGLVAILASLIAFVVMGWWVTIPGLIIGVLLMDLGVQSTQVTQQATVMALVPAARSRLNTLYMVGRFLGGAAGSALSAAAWSKYRWTGVSVVNLVLLVLAMMVHLIGWMWHGRSIRESRTPLEST